MRRLWPLADPQMLHLASQMLELEDHGARKANAGFCHSVASAFVGDIPCADLMVGDTGADPSVLANLRASGRRSWPPLRVSSDADLSLFLVMPSRDEFGGWS
jgi:hypothetical protein